MPTSLCLCVRVCLSVSLNMCLLSVQLENVVGGKGRMVGGHNLGHMHLIHFVVAFVALPLNLYLFLGATLPPQLASTLPLASCWKMLFSVSCFSFITLLCYCYMYLPMPSLMVFLPPTLHLNLSDLCCSI